MSVNPVRGGSEAGEGLRARSPSQTPLWPYKMETALTAASVVAASLDMKCETGRRPSVLPGRLSGLRTSGLALAGHLASNSLRGNWAERRQAARLIISGPTRNLNVDSLAGLAASHWLSIG